MGAGKALSNMEMKKAHDSDMSQVCLDEVALNFRDTFCL